MRIFTLFSLLLLSVATALAQPTVNFETGGAGAGYTWNVFENGNNPPLEIVANPSATGINTSATVAKFTARQAGNPWAGTENAHGAFPTFNFSASNSIVKIMVYKTVISDVGMKFAIASGGAQPERKVANTKINEWEELTFDFSNLVGSGLDGSVNISQIIVFPDFNARTQENIIYFDNITFSASGGGPPPATAPTVAATTPTRNAANVISMFSNAYTNVPVNTWRTDWSAATLTDLQIAGNDTKRYSNLDFVGIEAVGANSINASSMTYFHVDAWTPNMTTFKIKLVDFGANNAFGGGDDKEHELTYTPTQGQWNAYDILLTDFTGLTTKSNISQIIFVGAPAGSSTLFIDNVYFHNVAGGGPPAGTPPTVNFETGGAGAGYTWNVFENGNNPPLEIVANPSATGINTSATVAKFTARQAGNPWAGTENAHGAFPTFNFSASNSIVKIMVYKTVISDVGMKFAIASGGAQPERKVANTKINEWEELTFDFSNLVGSGLDGSVNISQIIVFPDFNARTQENIIYFDNITFSASGGGPPPATAPTVAATTPTRNAANVISMFSNAYTNVPVNTWRTDWSAATLTDLQIAGNDTKRYSNLDFVGIEAVGANSINASSMTYFHVDAWTPNMTTFKIKLVDFGANNAFGGGDDKEHELTYTPTQGQWNGYDILLTDFTGLTTKSNISQIIFVGAPAGSGSSTLFIDNVYFHNVAGGGPPPATEPTVAATTPTRNAANVISMFSNAYTNVPVNTWRTDWSAATLTDLQIAGNDTKKYSNLDFVGIEAVGANSINASSMTYFHVDAWTPNMTTFKIKLVDFGANNAFGGGDDKEHELTYTPTQGQWNSYDILLTDFTGLTTKSNISQIIFVGAPAGSSTLFIDNVYFHNVAGGGPPPATEPTVAATTPTRNAANVISMFSNAYTNVPVNTWRTDWSAATLTDLQIAGNDTKRYSNLDFVGIEAVGANSINASSMTYFHVDAWTPNMTTFRIKLVDFGANNAFGGGDDKEHELTYTPTQGQWNSYDILLTDFTGLTTKSNISQIIFVGAPAGSSTLFIDNVYFYNNNPTLGSQTITFPVITDKTVGNPAFQLTATASSNLAVSYSTVSNKVTISGSTVTIVSAGRVEIKANQAGNASFTAAPEVTRSFCIKPAKPTVTVTGANVETITLTSSAATGNKWFLNGTVIPSATNATLSVTAPGIYKVQVTVDDCISEFSADAPLIVTGDLVGYSNSVSAYPNPAEDYIELAGIRGELSNVQLVDLAGRRNTIDFEKRGDVYRANVQHLTLGIYLLQAQEGNFIHRIKVIKK